jgi:hypothetical protein
MTRLSGRQSGGRLASNANFRGRAADGCRERVNAGVYDSSSQSVSLSLPPTQLTLADRRDWNIEECCCSTGQTALKKGDQVMPFLNEYSDNGANKLPRSQDIEANHCQWQGGRFFNFQFYHQR